MKDSIKATIGRLIQDAQNEEQSERRSDLFDRYMGEPYGDETANRSKFISTDVADAVEAILPDLMDVFTSAEDIVEFVPVGPEDEPAAKQETAAVSHMFWQKNQGFEILYVWIKEALIQQNSYVKRGWQDKIRVEVEEYADLAPDEFLQIMVQAGPEAEILSQEGGIDEATGEFTPITVKLRTVKKEKRYCVEAIPQEEFFLTPRWNKVSLEGVPCCGHRRKMEVGDLKAMGFDEDSIKAAKDDNDWEQTDERFDTEDSYEDDDRNEDNATRQVQVYEAYCRVDIDGDGIAELVQVWATGDGSDILKRNGKEAVEEVSCVPFSALTPYIVPHRHIGRSVAELVDDVQKIKTVLYRHSLDNIYRTNYTRPHFDENSAGPHTYNDLMNPAAGAPVRTGGAQIDYPLPPQIIGTTLPLIERMDDLKESRTGATRYNQGLDANSLNKTATGIQKIMNASQKKTLLIARTIAETGLRDLFLGIHRDLRRGPVRELVMKLTGGWVPVSPRDWKDRTDVNVRVGMGTGDRENIRMGLQLMSTIQEKLMAGGSRMVDEVKLYETAQRMMATFGFKSVEPFLTHPSQLPPPPPPQPDPQMLLAQKQMEIMENESRSRIALDAQRAKMEHQRKMEEIRIKAAAEDRQAAKTASDIMTDAERLDLDRKKVAMTDDLERDKLAAPSAPPMSYSEL
jgi:hypothetical protein